jgi:polyisoprenoid-binding protein YceI
MAVSRGSGSAKQALWVVAALLGVGAVAVLALVAVTFLRSDNVELATVSPPLPTPPPGAKAPPPPASGVFHYVVEKPSKAKYVARDQIAVMPAPIDTAAETGDITGDLYLTKEGGLGSTKSAFKVDLRTLRSDESLRDRAALVNLAADRFPFAQFTLESVEGFPANYSEGKEVPLTLKGSLTLRETTKPVVWTAYARRGGEYLTAIADTDLKMTEYGITPPVASIARAEDGVHLQVTLVAKLSQ